MSREADYLVFAAEQYRFAKGLTGAQLVDLFERFYMYCKCANEYRNSVIAGN